jgi:signal transduction histidine kinase
LHDSLAQVLGSTHLRLRGLIGRADVADRPAVVAELADLAEVADEAYRDVREAILGLREASRPRGLLESLQAYLEKYTLQAGVTAFLETGLEDELSIPTSSEIQIIRVIQEALTNVRKHAGATTARIRVSSVGTGAGAGLMIVIEDDGRGFDTNATPVRADGGYGLQTMRERMELAGGTLRVDSAPGRGTRVVAILPEGARTHESGRLPDHR